MPDQESAEAAQARYMAAGHAMQSGVAGKMQFDAADTTPKHLRVGVNSALVSSSALAELLIAKGIITKSEVLTAMADGMEEEAIRYEQLLTEHYGTQVKLS